MCDRPRDWRGIGRVVRGRLYRVYGALLQLERDVKSHSPADRGALLERLDEIERQAHALKIPLGFADQFYVLREHVQLVRARLTTLAAVAQGER